MQNFLISHTRTRLVILASFVSLSVGCHAAHNSGVIAGAHSHDAPITSSHHSNPALASTNNPVGPPAGSGNERSATDGTSAAAAGDLLEKALFHLKASDARSAADAFQAAIDTGYLSNAGRALAYWYIHLSEQTLGGKDESAEALLSFVVLAEDLLHERIEDDPTGAESFIAQFDLERRLALARAALSVSWSGRAKSFGRSRDNPIPVHDNTELNYYVELTAPCNGSTPYTINRNTVPGPNDTSVQHVRLQCEANSGANINYFFEFRGSPPKDFTAVHAQRQRPTNPDDP